jgi:hypothetical protein
MVCPSKKNTAPHACQVQALASAIQCKAMQSEREAKTHSCRNTVLASAIQGKAIQSEREAKPSLTDSCHNTAVKASHKQQPPQYR